MPKADKQGYIATADFENIKAGDIFNPPAGWVRDPDFEIFRDTDKRRGPGQTGIAFIDPSGRRHILPVQEA